MNKKKYIYMLSLYIREEDNRSRISRLPVGGFLICEVTATLQKIQTYDPAEYRVGPSGVFSHPPLSKS